MIYGYKLFRLRKDGTLGSLFINRRARIPVNKWVGAETIPTEGFAIRTGFHCCAQPVAPHLSEKGRVWAYVALKGVTKHMRPAWQGGLWYTAKQMKVLEVG